MLVLIALCGLHASGGVAGEPKQLGGSHGTAVHFGRAWEAFHRAPEEKKLILLVHISGMFEDPYFTWNNAQAFREKALTNPEVGKLLNEHFAAGFHKVGTFTIVGGVKKGGNVATYFCTADGRVLHAIAGPVDALTLLAEAKWVLETHDKAKKAGKEGDEDYVKFVRQTHADRLKKDEKLAEPARRLEAEEKEILARFTRQAEREPTEEELTLLRKKLQESKNSTKPVAVHRLLALHALDPIEQVYAQVWEGILKEKVTNDPR